METYGTDSASLENRSPGSSSLLTSHYDSSRDFTTPQFAGYSGPVQVFDHNRTLDTSGYAPRSENSLQVSGQASLDQTSGPSGCQITVRVSTDLPLNSRNTMVTFGSQTIAPSKINIDGPSYLLTVTVPHGSQHYQSVEVIITNHNSKIISLPAGNFFISTSSVSEQSHGHGGSSSPGSPPGVTSRIQLGDHYEMASASQVSAMDSAYANAGSTYQEPSSASMITYRPSAYPAHMATNNQVMRPSTMSAPSWSFNTPIDSSNPGPIPMRPTSIPGSMHSGVDDGMTTRLIRSSMIPNHMSNGYPNSHSGTNHRVELRTSAPISEMTLGWKPEEYSASRRIVQFTRILRDDAIEVTFHPATSQARKPPGSAVVSCIYWSEHDSYYITSVDTILLLEQLLVSPSRFSVEEKNRIRRNLEGFKPLTVGKARPDTEEFFKVIMGFSNPKPRNIEKDVKVFSWNTLETALKKIVGKYAMINKPSELAARMSGMNPMTTTAYRPGSSPVSADGVSSGYGNVLPTPSFHSDMITSPRSNWGGYNTRQSPMDRPSANHGSIPSMDTRGLAGSTGTSFIPSMHVSQPSHSGPHSNHVAQTMATNRWDTTPATQYDGSVSTYGAPSSYGPGLADVHAHRGQ